MPGSQQKIDKIQSKLTEWSNLANRQGESINTLTVEKEDLAKKLNTTVQQRWDAEDELIQVLELHKKAAKDLEEARDDNKQLYEELVQLRASIADNKTLDKKLQETSKRLAKMEEIVHQMKKTDADLAEATKRIVLLEKAANPLVKALVPEDPTTLQSFQERLKVVPCQLKAFIKKSSETYLIHALAVMKSMFPEVDIAKCVEGAESNCMEENFKNIKKEAEPIAKPIAHSLKL